RKSKVDKTLFAKPLEPGVSFGEFLDALPNILKARELREIVRAIGDARKAEKPVILMMGAHVIKCGLSPLVIDLIRRRIVTCVAMNGAGVIHDFEIALDGRTSEDVAAALKDGSFGMARETAGFINGAVKKGAARGQGFGEAMGEAIARERLRFKELSIAYACRKRGIPLTVHVAIGTDIVHQHPDFSGADTGAASAQDFRLLVREVARLNRGGVVLNFGSAVLMPEVFLKALSVARNLTKRVAGFTTANFDMNVHYRPHQNIVTRPVLDSGRGYYIVGHHEIMLPLLRQAVLERGGRAR
ncbi:MAG: hypothetical protein ACM3L6_05980, partial [Deltaproteobacteria bacterium]